MSFPEKPFQFPAPQLQPGGERFLGTSQRHHGLLLPLKPLPPSWHKLGVEDSALLASVKDGFLELMVMWHDKQCSLSAVAGRAPE